MDLFSPRVGKTSGRESSGRVNNMAKLPPSLEFTKADIHKMVLSL
jgi:hypothetical protein